MSYVTPVTNHTASSYFNVADWNRIYNNAQLMCSLAEIKLGSPIVFTSVVAQTITTNPTTILLSIGTLLTNIDNARAAMAALLPALTTVKHDWLAGMGNVAPNYTHVNQWESTIDAIWDYWSGDNLPVCPSLSTDLTIPTATTAIYVDCIDVNGYNIEVQGTGILYII